MRMTVIVTTFSLLLYYSCNKVMADNWYIDNAANGSNNGTSWTDAWESFGDISWGSIGAGDTIYISGGPDTQTYTGPLTIGANGTNGNPIVIMTGAAHPTLSSGHDGFLIISGGNNGINYGSHDYVVINGNDGAGNINIRVTGTTSDGVVASNSISIGLLYVHVYRCGNSDNDDGIQFSSCTGGSEIAYCDVEDSWQDAVKVSGHFTPNAYGSVIVHHNYIHGMVDDGISGDGSVDVYNNNIGPWGTWSSATGHPDGMQMYAGYLRIYNNGFFTDVWPGSNGLIFLNHAFGWNHDFDHIRVYNNSFFLSGEPYSGAHFFGVSIAAQGGTGNEDVDDVLIANNTFVDVGHVAISITSEVGDARFTNFIIKNNIIYNCKLSGGPGVASFNGFDFNNSTVDFDNNIINEGSAGRTGIGWDGSSYSISEFNSTFSKSNITTAPVFITYSAGQGLSNDLHLHLTDLTARDGGISLSNYFSTDKDGVSRPQGAVWDIGAYEFVGGTSNAPHPPNGLKIKK